MISKVDWDGWVKQPGANPKDNGLDFTTNGAVEFSGMADYYINNAGKSPSNIKDYKETKDVQLKVVFTN